MANNRVYSHTETFHEIGQSSLYEDTYEGIVVQFREQLFPDHWCFDFKDELRTPRDTNVKADLLLIDREYQEWVLVEVELARHSWSGHVKDQVERLELAEISYSSVERLCDRESELDRGRLKYLIRGQLQRILVVCNDSPRWRDQFSQISAELLVARPYRDISHQLLLQTERDFRRRSRGDVSALDQPSESQPGWYRIRQPNGVFLAEGNIRLVFDNESVDGKIRRIGSDWYLVVSQSVAIQVTGGLAITKADNGTFEIRGRIVSNDD